jgi:diadenosine tetraphosphatase ApaH/serine/threonine PP2A family protein phosphatase
MTGSARLLLQRTQHLLASGRAEQARDAAIAALKSGTGDPVLLDAIGTVLSKTNEQVLARAAYDRAIALAPDEPHFVFNRATVRRFLGDLEGAEQDYDRVICAKPDDYEAYLNRSELRVQTRERNHIQQLQSLLAAGIPDWRGEVAVQYAIAKEYEDLGDYDRSFGHLHSGARLRRAHLRYDIVNDISTVDWIQQAYPTCVEAAPPPPIEGGAGVAAQIFIVGLPRSGSTLVERILGSHSKVRMGGELPQFALSVVAAVNRRSEGVQLRRQDLIAQSARVDFAALGQDYMTRVNAFGIRSDCFTDKMPLNYLYCGLIRRALSNARIVHVHRHPMAAGYAIYKTLFRDGYPFSYDLRELGSYYVAYRRLMRHWSETLPGAILDLRYEDLVADPARETRRLLDFCGLDWEDACADFHSNTAPTTTASAAQVRRRLYSTSVSQWRHYEAQLAPLREQLQAGGIYED